MANRSKRELASMTAVLGALLAVLAAVLLPAAAAAPPRLKAVEAQVKVIHEGEGPADPSWVEYWYEYGVPTYIARFEGPAGSLREGDRVTLYIDKKQPETVRKEPHPGSYTDLLAWITLVPVGLLFAGNLALWILASGKEKRHADT